MRYELQWSVGFSDTSDSAPETRVPASVPGAVQLDWALSQGWPDIAYADNYKAYAWMEDKYWTYSTTLVPVDLNDDERLYFVSEGIDYEFDVFLGNLTFHQEGMFTPVELDITEYANLGGEIRILVYPTPKRKGAKGRAQADQSCKPPVSYGWDWHPRLIPLGIWDDTYIEVRPACRITDADTDYTLSDDFKTADLTLKAVLNGPVPEGTVMNWTLSDKQGESVFSRTLPAIADIQGLITSHHTLTDPELWWPNGEGEPVLYTSRVDLVIAGRTLDTEVQAIGFRRVRLAMYPGAWSEPEGYPKSRSHPPITMEINGRRIFCKGTNWVNPEIFPGIMTEETYRPLLELATDAHFNLLRVWGGGIVNKESFFRLCDSMGLMVWQEFPLACNNYVGTPHYLGVLDQESKSIVKRLKKHASVVLWCGGNELFNGWSGMTDQSLALRLLNRNCYDLDPETPFIMTSPLDGMAHGHYSFRYSQDTDVFQAMAKARFTAYTEFGCPGPSSEEYLRGFIPEEDLFPPRPGTAWEDHHAFKAWLPEAWLMPSIIEGYFGPMTSLGKLVECGQLLQSQGYKCIYEEARRQKPRCSMALNWCYNEPWPSAANNSLINYPAEPKPAYYAVQASCRPVLASARIPRFDWKSGDTFTPELWMLNDSPLPVAPGTMRAYIKFGDEELLLLQWDYQGMNPNTNLQGPSARITLPERDADRMSLILRVEGLTALDSEYVLAYRKVESHHGHGGTGLMNT